MQFSDFFNAGNGLADKVKIVLFKMLPRRAQIDKDNKTINADLDLKGEKEGVRIALSNYRLIQEVDKNPLFEAGTIEVSREWLNALLKTLVKTGVIPERMEVKNLLHQAVVKSIL